MQTWYQYAPLHHLLVSQITRQSDNPFPLYGNFRTLIKRRKIKKLFLKVYMLVRIRNAWCNLVEIWNLGVLTMEGISIAKIVKFCRSRMKLCMCENCVIVYPVNIRAYSTVWHAGFLGCTTHYRVSWYTLNWPITFKLSVHLSNIFLACSNWNSISSYNDQPELIHDIIDDSDEDLFCDDEDDENG